MNCAKCGEVLVPGYAFCTNCGAKMTMTTPVQPPSQQNSKVVRTPYALLCAKCRKPIVPGNDFCLNCGSRISDLPNSTSSVSSSTKFTTNQPFVSTQPSTQPSIQSTTQPTINTNKQNIVPPFADYTAKTSSYPQPINRSNQQSSYPQPVTPKPDIMEVEKEHNRRANLLCGIFLLMYFGSYIISFTILWWGFKIPTTFSFFTNILGLLVQGSRFVAIVILIVTRIVYPKNKLVRVLLVLWIIFIVLSFLGVVFIFLWFMSLFTTSF